MITAETEIIAKRFGLEPIPKSVLRLTSLIASQNADLEAIAGVIKEDPALTERLLRLTPPPRDKTQRPSDETAVQMALMRSGLSLIFLLAMGDLLSRALVNVFDIMLNLDIDAANPKDLSPILDRHLMCEVNFRGKSTGKIQLRLTEDSARLLACRMLGVPPNSLSSTAEKDDAILELTHIITGNFLSNLADAGLTCPVTIPVVYRSTDFTIRSIPGGVCERLAFRCSEARVFMDISVNPWND